MVNIVYDSRKIVSCRSRDDNLLSTCIDVSLCLIQQSTFMMSRFFVIGGSLFIIYVMGSKSSHFFSNFAVHKTII